VSPALRRSIFTDCLLSESHRCKWSTHSSVTQILDTAKNPRDRTWFLLRKKFMLSCAAPWPKHRLGSRLVQHIWNLIKHIRHNIQVLEGLWRQKLDNEDFVWFDQFLGVNTDYTHLTYHRSMMMYRCTHTKEWCDKIVYFWVCGCIDWGCLSICLHGGVCAYEFACVLVHVHVHLSAISLVSVCCPLPCSCKFHTATHCNTLQHTATHCNTL